MNVVIKLRWFDFKRKGLKEEELLHTQNSSQTKLKKKEIEMSGFVSVKNKMS